MCGIVGIVANKPVVNDLLAALGNLEYRGYDSAGIAIAHSGKLMINKNVGYVSDLKVDKTIQGNIGIGHCRWATHGSVTDTNAHPHSDCSGDIAIVHNGIVENYEELKAELVSHAFKSETDSEVIAHLIEHYMTVGSFELAFQQAVKQLRGSYAIVAIHKDYPFLMVARAESPLMIGMGGGVYIASDIMAMPTDDVREIPEGSIEKISLDMADSTSGSNVINKYSGKGAYPHYMLKEISEQPATILDGLEQDRDNITGAVLDILRAKNVILTACGTSRFAGVVGRYLMSYLANKFTELIVSSELHYFADSFDNSTLVLAISQSGETADVLNGVKMAKRNGSRIISIVNKGLTSLERASDTTLFMNCGDEIAVASTKAFTNELIIFYLLSFMMANQYDSGLRELSELPDKVRWCLDKKAEVEKVAAILSQAEHIYYIAKGITFAVAGECALKLKEVSYIHAESMSAGELKHGTLSLIESGVPVIGLCPDDYTYEETISNLHEAKSRGGLIIGISDRKASVFDYWLPIPKVRDIYYPVVIGVIGQLLAYYTAIHRGINPDRPRNLAKSVTVR